MIGRSQGRAPGGELPTFLVIGAMKAGTTSLYHYLQHHEQVFMSKIKELDFFVEEMNWRRGVPWYRRQFRDAPAGALARGEASTAYSKAPRYAGVPERIAAVVPDVRLVYVVRDPLARIRSHYQHRVAIGAETAPPEVALLDNPIYLDYSRYGMQVERYLDAFPREQLLVVTSEALRTDRERTVRSVFTFLGVAPEMDAPALDREFYRTDTRRSHSPLSWSARQLVKRHVPQAKRAKEVVDSWSVLRAPRRGAGSLGGRGGAAAPDPLVGPVRERLTALLDEDVRTLRRHMGPQFDGWGLGQGAADGR